MFLAPLNYDRFFRKVFSDTNIAKAFLEDFLDVTIEEITKLDDKYRVTDDASTVEFDFRCKINGAYVIIDMQQWYKRDIGKRFYLYHAVNTGLQLEKLPQKKIIIDTLNHTRTKDYSHLEPVITLIWLSVDTFGFKENYVSYALAPEIVVEFLRNEELWRSPNILKLLEERARVLDVMNNKKKDLDFLAKNRLIFVLQGNIAGNKTHARYARWFTFAEKSKNEENKEADFKEYMNDVIFKEIIYRLDKRELKPEDIEYMDREKKYWLEIIQAERGIFEEGREEGKKEGIEEGKKKGIEEGKKEGKKEGIEEEKCNIARNLKLQHIGYDVIANVTGLSIDEIEKL